MLRYVELKGKPKEFLVATGLTDEEFQTLLPTFEKCYQLSSKPKPKALDESNNSFAVGSTQIVSRAGFATEMFFDKSERTIIYHRFPPILHVCRLR